MIDAPEAVERLQEATAEHKRLQERLRQVEEAVAAAESESQRLQGEKSTLLEALARGIGSEKERSRSLQRALEAQQALHDARELRDMVASLLADAAKKCRAAQLTVDHDRAAQLRTEGRALLNAAAPQVVQVAQALEHAAASFEEAGRLSMAPGTMPLVRSDLRRAAGQLRIWFDPTAIDSLMR